MMNGHQKTILWHVDDLKVSHKDPKVNTKFGKWLVEKYEDREEHGGNHHEHLCMDFDWSDLYLKAYCLMNSQRR
jgi:hypothetical protein